MLGSRVPRGAFERLEPLEGKLSRAVLRGGGDGNVTSLPDPWGSNPPGPPGRMSWRSHKLLPQCDLRPILINKSLYSKSHHFSHALTGEPNLGSCVRSLTRRRRQGGSPSSRDHFPQPSYPLPVSPLTPRPSPPVTPGANRHAAGSSDHIPWAAASPPAAPPGRGGTG